MAVNNVCISMRVFAVCLLFIGLFDTQSLCAQGIAVPGVRTTICYSNCLNEQFDEIRFLTTSFPMHFHISTMNGAVLQDRIAVCTWGDAPVIIC